MKIGNCPQCGSPLKELGISETLRRNYEKCVICKKNYCNKCIKAWLCPEDFNQLSIEDQRYFSKLSENITFSQEFGCGLGCIFGILIMVIFFLVFPNYRLIILVLFILFFVLNCLITEFFIEPLYKKENSYQIIYFIKINEMFKIIFLSVKLSLLKSSK